MRIGKIVATSVCLTACLLGSGSSLAERAQGQLLVTATLVRACSSASVVTTLPDGTVVPQVTVDCGAATPYQVSVDGQSTPTTTPTSGGTSTRSDGKVTTVTVNF